MTVINERIINLLFEEDIEGLLAVGTPADEYDDEAAQIATALKAMPPLDRTEQAIMAMIAMIWGRSFNLSAEQVQQRLPAFERLARRIVKSEEKFP